MIYNRSMVHSLFCVYSIELKDGEILEFDILPKKFKHIMVFTERLAFPCYIVLKKLSGSFFEMQSYISNKFKRPT